MSGFAVPRDTGITRFTFGAKVATKASNPAKILQNKRISGGLGRLTH